MSMTGFIIVVPTAARDAFKNFVIVPVDWE